MMFHIIIRYARHGRVFWYILDGTDGTAVCQSAQLFHSVREAWDDGVATLQKLGQSRNPTADNAEQTAIPMRSMDGQEIEPTLGQ